MTAILDTNVIIGLTDPSDNWNQWALEQFVAWKQQGPLILLDIVYAEVSVGMRDKAEMDAVVNAFGLQRLSGTDAAFYRAGEAFRLYKKRGGPKLRVLPDMIIGAVAEVEGVTLVTANAADFKSYFPKLTLITP